MTMTSAEIILSGTDEEIDFYRSNHVQAKMLAFDKWIEGERINQDPGVAFELDWVYRKAAWFREMWNKSLCRKCKKYNTCGYKLKKECNNCRI